VKSLARLKLVSDELFQRSNSVADAEVEALLIAKVSGSGPNRQDAARILIVDEDETAAARLRLILSETYRVDIANDANSALIKAIEADYDSIVVSAAFTYYDPLRLCSQLRTIERTRLVPIILIVREDEGALVVPAGKAGAFCAAAHTDQAQVLQRSAAAEPEPLHHHGRYRRPHRPAQSPLSRYAYAGAV
jgi:two-component system cell cycle response regulator